MADQDLYSGLIRLHVLYHASVGVVFGLGIIRELRRHGYRVGPGTLYPILHRLEEKGYLRSTRQLVKGKVRRVYEATRKGRADLSRATQKVRELYEEMVEGGGEPSPAHPDADPRSAAGVAAPAPLRRGKGHARPGRRRD